MTETTSKQLAEIEGQTEPIQVREGRWRTRGGQEFPVSAMPTSHDDFSAAYPWWDGNVTTWANDGRFSVHENAMDLLEYLGPIEEQPQPQAEPVQVPDSNEQIRLLKECNARQAELIADLKYERSGAMERAEVSARSSRKLTEQIEELRSEVSYVQNLLGTERRRVTELEELASSLRTINRGCENAVREAGKMNTALRNQLAAVKAELVTQAETIRRLQIELDAAQQVPADSPELRQLRLDLAEVIRERDTYRDGYDRVLSDLETIRETTKAETVEAIAEWLEPIKGAIDAADNQDELARAGFFAIDTIRHLPAIMRSLTGLADEEIE